MQKYNYHSYVYVFYLNLLYKLLSYLMECVQLDGSSRSHKDIGDGKERKHRSRDEPESKDSGRRDRDKERRDKHRMRDEVCMKTSSVDTICVCTRVCCSLEMYRTIIIWASASE